MNKNITINMGNCNHRRYIPHLVELVRTEIVDPTTVLRHAEPIEGAIDAYRHFNLREPGWMKVELQPNGA